MNARGLSHSVLIKEEEDALRRDGHGCRRERSLGDTTDEDASRPMPLDRVDLIGTGSQQRRRMPARGIPEFACPLIVHPIPDREIHVIEILHLKGSVERAEDFARVPQIADR